MTEALNYLREFNTASVFLRLTLAMFLGGLMGLERGRMHRPAGFRTYLLVCLGASLTMILSQYCYDMQSSEWADLIGKAHLDISRLGAQVISGIGFLGAGTMLITRRQHVKGLTTAAGLWTAGCMGLAIGAGFYECVLPVFLLIFLSVRFFPWLEAWMVEKDRNMNFYVEFCSLDDLGKVISSIKAQHTQVLEVELDRGEISQTGQPNGVFTVRLSKGLSHTRFLSAMTELECITMIQEL